MQFVLFSLGVVFILIGCGGESQSQRKFGGVQRDSFMSACTQNAGGASAATLGYCDCVLTAMLQKYTDAQFEELGELTIANQLIQDGTTASCSKKFIPPSTP